MEDKIFADKGYISKDIFTNLKNMKTYLLEMDNKISLRKRSLVELEHIRHRFPVNFIIHILVFITAFTLNKILKHRRLA